jgi:hypothetical protein
MKISRQSPHLKFLFLLLLFNIAQISFADDSAASVSTDSSHNKKTDSSDSSSTIVVHKPATDPAWGKVIQCQEEKSTATSDKTEETQYKFLFQDSNGIVRTAIYHESSSGNGYWEVWVWDQQ